MLSQLSDMAVNSEKALLYIIYCILYRNVTSNGHFSYYEMFIVYVIFSNSSKAYFLKG